MKLYFDASSNGWRRLGLVFSVVVPLLVLAGVFGPSLLGHVRQSLLPASINGDACQHVAPYLQYSRPEVFEGDYPVFTRSRVKPLSLFDF